MPTTEIAGKTGRYTVHKRLGSTDDYTVYLCTPVGTERQCLLKIVKTPMQNGLLDREAYALRELQSASMRAEELYAQKHPDGYKLNYLLTFPDLVETFVSAEQDERRVNIVGFNDVDQVGLFVPIGHITSVDRVRVDPMTGAWMMGRLLKLLSFAHAQDISVNRITGDNVLIERDKHYVVVFDWTKAKLHPRRLLAEAAAADIAQAAAVVMRVLGGDPVKGTLPEHEQLTDERYAEFFRQCLKQSFETSKEAHAAFYQLLAELWPRVYHPYTTIPLQAA